MMMIGHGKTVCSCGAFTCMVPNGPCDLAEPGDLCTACDGRRAEVDDAMAELRGAFVALSTAVPFLHTSKAVARRFRCAVEDAREVLES